MNDEPINPHDEFDADEYNMGYDNDSLPVIDTTAVESTVPLTQLDRIEAKLDQLLGFAMIIDAMRSDVETMMKEMSEKGPLGMIMGGLFNNG